MLWVWSLLFLLLLLVMLLLLLGNTRTQRTTHAPLNPHTTLFGSLGGPVRHGHSLHTLTLTHHTLLFSSFLLRPPSKAVNAHTHTHTHARTVGTPGVTGCNPRFALAKTAFSRSQALFGRDKPENLNFECILLAIVGNFARTRHRSMIMQSSWTFA